MLEELTEMACRYAVSRGKADRSKVDVSLRAGDPNDRTLCPVLLKRGSSRYWIPLLMRMAAPPRALPEGWSAWMMSYPLILRWDLGEKWVSATSRMSIRWTLRWCSTMALLFCRPFAFQTTRWSFNCMSCYLEWRPQAVSSGQTFSPSSSPSCLACERTSLLSDWGAGFLVGFGTGLRDSAVLHAHP